MKEYKGIYRNITGWLAGWLTGCLAAWLAGWLADVPYTPYIPLHTPYTFPLSTFIYSTRLQVQVLCL